MTSHQTWVNDAVGWAEKFIEDNPDGLTTPWDETIAKELIGKIKEKLSNMEKKWTNVFLPQLEADDPGILYADWDLNVHDTSKQAENSIDELNKAIKTFEAKGTATTTAPATPSETKKVLKLDPLFKPSILPRSSNLEEFYTWETTFRGYYETNKAFLAASTPEMRRLFITNLLDPKLQSALFTDKNITLETPIVSTGAEESLLSWLKNYLLRHTPLFVRRYEYAMCRQQPKESFEDWWTRKLIKAKHCDLTKINEETYQITELICGINNQKMRDDMLKIKEPTLEELVTLGKSYDTSARIQKATFVEEASVNKVQSKYKKNKSNDSRHKA